MKLIVPLQPSKPLCMNFTSTQEREQFGRRHKIDKRAQQQQANSGHRLYVPSIRGDLIIPGRYEQEDFSAQSLKIKIGEHAFSNTWTGSNTRADAHTYESLEACDDRASRSLDRRILHEEQDYMSDIPNMLESSSFQGFSDQSGRVNESFSRPTTPHNRAFLDQRLLKHERDDGLDEVCLSS